MSEVQLRWVPCDKSEPENNTFRSAQGKYTDGFRMKLQFRQQGPKRNTREMIGADLPGRWSDWQDVPVVMNPAK